MKNYFLILFVFAFSFNVSAQSFEELAANSLKKMQPRYTKLDNAQISTKVRSRGSAMAASYTWWSVFRKPAKRKYKVLLNKNVEGEYICFEFDRLSPTARDGVMAHELAHIDYFHGLNFFGFMKFILNQALPNGLRKSERATDYRTIANGMGKELRVWSKETREMFEKSSDHPLPENFSRRYLSPSEIDSVIKKMPNIYPVN